MRSEGVKKAWHSLLAYFYPPFCLMCRKPLSSTQRVCDLCAHEIELIDPIERCSFCFHEKASCSAPCDYCLKHPPHPRLFGQAYCLYESSLTSLLMHSLSIKQDHHLEMALASLVYVQLTRLNWPTPDLVMMEPSHCLLPDRRKRELSNRLATKLAHLFKVPCLKTTIAPSSLINPYKPMESQLFSGSEKISFPKKKPFHGMNILAFTLEVRSKTTWKIIPQALSEYGLPRVWNIGLLSTD